MHVPVRCHACSCNNFMIGIRPALGKLRILEYYLYKGLVIKYRGGGLWKLRGGS